MRTRRDKSRDRTLQIGDLLTSGRYKGQLIQHVIDKNPLYVAKWVSMNPALHLSRELRERMYDRLARMKDGTAK